MEQHESNIPLSELVSNTDHNKSENHKTNLLTPQLVLQNNFSSSRYVLSNLHRQQNLNHAPIQLANQGKASQNNQDTLNLEAEIQGLKLSNDNKINHPPVTTTSGTKEQPVNMLSHSVSVNMAQGTYAQIQPQTASRCEPFFMTGDKGFCNLCNILLTSRQHCIQHTGGKNHQKKVMEAESRAAFSVPSINNPSDPLQNFNSQHNDFRSSTHTTGPNGENYVLNAAGGHCFICRVDFTSPSHAQQHLAGQKHKKKSTSLTVQGALALNQSSSLVQSQLPAAHQQPSSFTGQNNSQLVVTEASTALPPHDPPRGPNGEVFVMRGTRGHCFVCDIELTSREHAQSHLSGSKHAKKCAINSIATGDSMVPPPGKILKCALCDVPFSCMGNAVEHFQSEKHKKKVQTISPMVSSELDYSNDPEQTEVKILYSFPASRSSAALHTFFPSGASRTFSSAMGDGNNEKIGNICTENPESQHLSGLKSDTSFCSSESDYSGVMNPANNASEIDQAGISISNQTIKGACAPTNLSGTKYIADFSSNLNEVTKLSSQTVDMKIPLESLTDNTLQPHSNCTRIVDNTMQSPNNNYTMNVDNKMQLAGSEAVPLDLRFNSRSSGVGDKQNTNFVLERAEDAGNTCQLKLKQTTLNDEAREMARSSLNQNILEPVPGINHSLGTLHQKKLMSVKEKNSQNPVGFSHGASQESGSGHEENLRTSGQGEQAQSVACILTKQQYRSTEGNLTFSHDTGAQQYTIVSDDKYMIPKRQDTLKDEVQVRSEHEEYTPQSSKQSRQNFAQRVLYFTPMDQQQKSQPEKDLVSQLEANEPAASQFQSQSNFMSETRVKEAKFNEIKQDHVIPVNNLKSYHEEKKINKIPDAGQVSSPSVGQISSPSAGQVYSPNHFGIQLRQDDMLGLPTKRENFSEVLATLKNVGNYSNQQLAKTEAPSAGQISQIAGQVSPRAGQVSSPNTGQVSSPSFSQNFAKDFGVTLRPAEMLQQASHGDNLSEVLARVKAVTNYSHQQQTETPLEAAYSHVGHEQSDALEQPYVFNGLRGFCYACNIDLTSLQHANQHLNGQKHQKKAAQIHYTQALQKGVTSPLPLPSTPVASIPTTSPYLVQALGAPDDKPYIFNGFKGYCYVCNIELSSYPHANQHLNGKSHKRNSERSNMAKQGIEYPNYCSVCRKRFTGTESAAQHFTSSKHKNKACLAGEDVMTVKHVDEGRVILKDGQVWYFCDICQCPVNTEEQFLIHKETSKHKKELKVKQESQSKSQNQETVSNIEPAADRRPPLLDDQPQNVIRNISLGTSVPHCVLDENRHHLTYGESPVVNTSECLWARHGTPPKEDVITNAEFTDKGHPILGGGVFPACHIPVEPRHIPVERYAANVNPTASLQQLSHGSSTDYSHFGYSTGFGLHNFGAVGEWRGSNKGSGSGLGSTGSFRNGHGQLRGESPSCNGLMNRSNDEQGAAGWTSGRELDNLRDGGSVAFGNGVGNTARLSEEGFMKMPGKTQRSISRGREKGPRDIISLDKREEDYENDDDSYARENVLKNLNIQEEVEKLLQLNPAPERSTKQGFRYCCKTCDKHMNTLESYYAHIKGNNHLYMSSLKSAPTRDLGPIAKAFQQLPSQHDIFQICKEYPRFYQVELVEKAMAGDNIIYLPTGTGKTLVAVMTMALMLEMNPSRPVLFLVDKVLLVLQQTHYIKMQLEGKKFTRTDLKDGRTPIHREIVIKAICGGLTSKSDMPIWKFDIVITTAAFCHNMLQRGLIRWEDFSLIVLDEVHHCNKHHPYHKLLSGYHSCLPPSDRAKMLGLTASPAGKTSEKETYNMLRGLLENLGRASVAIVENHEDELKTYESNAEVHAICVPMTNREREFRLQLLEYMVMCYSRFASLSTLRDSRTAPCSFLLQAVLNPQDKKVARQIAENFLKDEEPLSELQIHINMATCVSKDSQDVLKFDHLRLHLATLLLTIPEVGTGANFIEELCKVLAPGDTVQVFESMGLPCKEMLNTVKIFEGSGEKDNTIFTKLIEILQDESKIKIQDPASKTLVLVRERKIARQISHKLREEPLIKANNLRVTHLVGHGNAHDHGMDVKKQKRVLDNQERYNIFVATSIMEEGVDFQSLQLVVSMNPPTSLRALVQIRGRARKQNSHFVILCSSEEEVQKLETLRLQEKNMQAAAKRCIEEDRKAAQQR